jgi:hypothetical protein
MVNIDISGVDVPSPPPTELKMHRRVLPTSRRGISPRVRKMIAERAPLGAVTEVGATADAPWPGERPGMARDQSSNEEVLGLKILEAMGNDGVVAAGKAQGQANDLDGEIELKVPRRVLDSADTTYV